MGIMVVLVGIVVVGLVVFWRVKDTQHLWADTFAGRKANKKSRGDKPPS